MFRLRRPPSFVLGLLFGCALAASFGAQAIAASVIRDEEIEQNLKTFMRPVLTEAGVSPSSVRFIILDNREINAFVAGGQNIFLNTALILQTKNVDELVGVGAHETGHIAHGD